MPKTLTMAQACRATGLSRYTLSKLAEEYDVGMVIKSKSGYKKYFIDPAKLSAVIPITEKDVKKAVKK